MTNEACSPTGNAGDECNKCGYVTPDPGCTHIAPGDWNFGLPATCTTASTRQKRCIDCNATLETETQAELGHDFGTSKNNGTHECKRTGCTVTQTCSPNTAGATCSTCGYLTPTSGGTGNGGNSGGSWTPTPSPSPNPTPTPNDTLDANKAADLVKSGESVTIKQDGVTVTLGTDALALLAAACDKDGKSIITVETAAVPMKDLTGMQAAQVKGYETVISIDVFLDGEKINVPLTVSLPYALKANENPAAVRVWHMDDKGKLTCMNGVYDTATGLITFTIQHQSYFVVGYDPVALWVNVFSDLSSDAWYYEAIAFMNQHGLMVGYGNGIIGAEDTLTRSQFATLLWNLEGKPMPNGTASFTDVREGAWYYNPVIWATENGVVVGIGGGLFDPNTPITRAQVAQMLYNYAVNFKGYEIPENRDMPNYTDKDQIDLWAETAARKLAEAGVLTDEDEFRPKDDATRGEAAEMFRNFIRFIAGE